DNSYQKDFPSVFYHFRIPFLLKTLQSGFLDHSSSRAPSLQIRSSLTRFLSSPFINASFASLWHCWKTWRLFSSPEPHQGHLTFVVNRLHRRLTSVGI
ncbi:hypothetical protein Gotur_027035, partial [Gossypium turneri]